MSNSCMHMIGKTSSEYFNCNISLITKHEVFSHFLSANTSTQRELMAGAINVKEKLHKDAFKMHLSGTNAYRNTEDTLIYLQD